MDKKLRTKVKVIIRVRPPLSEEAITCVHSSRSDHVVEIFNHRNKYENLQYEFSSVYDGKATQKEIFDECVEPLLGNSFSGQNVSIFAYGPTGAGKTHTMLGKPEDPGIISRVMKWIFDKIGAESAAPGGPELPKTTVTLSYLEIYNEKVRDLMLTDTTDLPIREDHKHNIFVAGLTEKVVESFEAVKSHFGPACNNRSVAATNLNEHSSRSHSIVLLKITRRMKDKEYVGKIHLIDLAGSEDNRRTGNKGIRLKESGAINRSLFALGEVVDAINKNLARVPYRNSKLTRLLQDSLGGSCHSLMVTNIAPEEHYYYDTYCTLNFASKSKKITNTNITTVNSLETAPKPPSLKRSSASDTALVPPKKMSRQVSSSSLSSTGISSSTVTPSPWKSSVNERIKELEKQLLEVRGRVSTNEQASVPRSDGVSPSKAKRRSARLSSSSSSSSSSMVPSNLEATDCPKSDSPSLFSTDTDESPDLIYATPIISKRKNALKDSSNLLVQRLFGVHHRNHPRLQRVLDSGPSCSPLFQDLPSSKNQKQNEKDVTPYGKVADDVSSRLGFGCLGWQEKRNSAFLEMINSASVKDLQQLQTVGAKRAKLIFEWRELHGPFSQIEALTEIPGINDKYFERLLKSNLIKQ